MSEKQDDLLEQRCDEVIRLCREKGLDGQDTFIIGAIINDQDAVNKFGEIEAFDIAIQAIKSCTTRDEVFESVIKALDAIDLNSEIEIELIP